MNTMTLRQSPLFRFIAVTVLVAFVAMLPAQPSYAQAAIVMPVPGQMLHITSSFEPPQMIGLKVNLKDPFSFDFIMDQGQTPMSDDVKKEEFNKIIKYFLVSLAMPNKDMWVNLSPYESKRMIPEVFGQTEMGRDLLSQDYVLKQFTASLMYPEDGLGKKFWDKVYAQAQERFGTTDINVNTFNKVWIVADHADVYQKGDAAFLVDSHLKVMLEQDYMAIEKHKDENMDAKTKMASEVVRQIIIPAIEKEVNEGRSFAAVRQVYNAEIMATWFKKTLRQSLLGQVFANRAKIAGQRISDPQEQMESIYRQYLKAYKKGVFNYIREDVTPDGQVVPRKYFSGGMQEVSDSAVISVPATSPKVADFAMSANTLLKQARLLVLSVGFLTAGGVALVSQTAPAAPQQNQTTQSTVPVKFKAISVKKGLETGVFQIGALGNVTAENGRRTQILNGNLTLQSNGAYWEDVKHPGSEVRLIWDENKKDKLPDGAYRDPDQKNIIYFYTPAPPVKKVVLSAEQQLEQARTRLAQAEKDRDIARADYDTLRNNNAPKSELKAAHHELNEARDKLDDAKQLVDALSPTAIDRLFGALFEHQNNTQAQQRLSALIQQAKASGQQMKTDSVALDTQLEHEKTSLMQLQGVLVAQANQPTARSTQQAPAAAVQTPAPTIQQAGGTPPPPPPPKTTLAHLPPVQHKAAPQAPTAQQAAAVQAAAQQAAAQQAATQRAIAQQLAAQKLAEQQIAAKIAAVTAIKIQIFDAQRQIAQAVVEGSKQQSLLSKVQLQSELDELQKQLDDIESKLKAERQNDLKKDEELQALQEQSDLLNQQLGILQKSNNEQVLKQWALWKEAAIARTKMTGYIGGLLAIIAIGMTLIGNLTKKRNEVEAAGPSDSEIEEAEATALNAEIDAENLVSDAYRPAGFQASLDVRAQLLEAQENLGKTAKDVVTAYFNSQEAKDRFYKAAPHTVQEQEAEQKYTTAFQEWTTAMDRLDILKKSYAQTLAAALALLHPPEDQMAAAQVQYKGAESIEAETRAERISIYQNQERTLDQENVADDNWYEANYELMGRMISFTNAVLKALAGRQPRNISEAPAPPPPAQLVPAAQPVPVSRKSMADEIIAQLPDPGNVALVNSLWLRWKNQYPLSEDDKDKLHALLNGLHIQHGEALFENDFTPEERANVIVSIDRILPTYTDYIRVKQVLDAWAGGKAFNEEVWNKLEARLNKFHIKTSLNAGSFLNTPAEPVAAPQAPEPFSLNGNDPIRDAHEEIARLKRAMNSTDDVDTIEDMHRKMTLLNDYLQAKLNDDENKLVMLMDDPFVKSVVDKAQVNNVGGINLSDEHLTINIKVDGAGMPLPVQYQDAAMMNLNGLTSIIRRISPATPQNVPELYELLK